MIKRYTEYTLMACAVLISLSLTAKAWAADVNKVVETCANCHGKGGASTEPEVPIIGGYSAACRVRPRARAEHSAMTREARAIGLVR